MPLTHTATIARSVLFLAHMLEQLKGTLPARTAASLLEVTYDLQGALLQAGVLRGADITAAAAWLAEMQTQMLAILDTYEGETHAST
jgi:hypothetical protein